MMASESEIAYASAAALLDLYRRGALSTGCSRASTPFVLATATAHSRRRTNRSGAGRLARRFVRLKACR
jgi:hypothetical protein